MKIEIKNMEKLPKHMRYGNDILEVEGLEIECDPKPTVGKDGFIVWEQGDEIVFTITAKRRLKR